MKRLNILALLLFLGAFVAVMLIPAPATRKIQRAVGTLFAPFTKAGSKVQDALTSDEERPRSPDELKSENVELRRELDLIRLEKQKFEAIDQQNRELTTALDFRRRYGYTLVSAEIMNRRVSAWYREARIDKGLKDGIREEAPVVTPVLIREGNVTHYEGALVGKIGRCEDNMATIVLVTDETCRVAATVKGAASVRGILMGQRAYVGTTAPDLNLRFLRPQPVLEPGMQIVSDGIDRTGVFPYGILLGEIKEFVPSRNGAEPLATVRSMVDLDALRYVFVLQPDEKTTAPTTAPPVAAPVNAVGAKPPTSSSRQP